MAVIFTLLLGVLAFQEPQSWPVVATSSSSVSVNLASPRIEIDLPIRDIAGRVVYTFACRGGRELFLDSLPGNWVGPLMCTLAAGTEAQEEGLLSEDASPAWHSRGQFHAADLVGACAEYPEFGRLRTFRLRGFRLVLEARDVAVDATGTATAFTLAVSVGADPGATTQKAARPGYLDPSREGRSCATVLRGEEPRMCRNADTLSWEPCRE